MTTLTSNRPSDGTTLAASADLTEGEKALRAVATAQTRAIADPAKRVTRYMIHATPGGSRHQL
jgi:hypothetical protein